MKRRILTLILAAALCLGALPLSAGAAGTRYSDVPQGFWAAESIEQASTLGLVNGIGGGKFGLGIKMDRASFVALLCRMFQWPMVTPDKGSYTDNQDKNIWYYDDVETAYSHGAITAENGRFRPGDYITREEMAVMLVRALGYTVLAGNVQSYGIPFTDVTANKGYITIAYDIGMTTGTTGTTFSPKGQATREEALTMLMRVYSKYTAKLSWLHGFYAISSYSQKDMTADMDAISLGWSRMEYQAGSGPVLNTKGTNGNEWKIPDQFTLATDYFKQNGTPANLNVYMDRSAQVTLADGTKTDACSAVLLTPAARTQAVGAIIAEVTRTFPETGNNIYAGVTIDFEGMKGTALKAGFTAFLQQLNTELDKVGKTLYVTVPPALSSGSYYDAYDFRAIGAAADKVILMAHDYNATTMPDNLVGTTFTATPLSPLESVYYALRAVADPKTGVADKSKLALAVSIDSVGWTLKDGKVADVGSISLTPSAIDQKLIDSKTVMNYSERYQNPYITYSNGDGTTTLLWYEDARSIGAKIELARLFGVNGLSVWRLGTIPTYQSTVTRELYYNVWDKVLSYR